MSGVVEGPHGIRDKVCDDMLDGVRADKVLRNMNFDVMHGLATKLLSRSMSQNTSDHVDESPDGVWGGEEHNQSECTSDVGVQSSKEATPKDDDFVRHSHVKTDNKIQSHVCHVGVIVHAMLRFFVPISLALAFYVVLDVRVYGTNQKG
jgi:hypothetical protein